MIDQLVKLVKQVPKDIKNWPKVYVPLNCELVFKPYGKDGRGFYIVETK